MSFGTGGNDVGFDEADDMCPNCVTPWKCNGPHLSEQTVAARRLARPAPPSEGREAEAYAAGRLAGFEEGLSAAPPSEGLDVELERLRRIEHAARDVDGLWSESRTLIHWQVEAGEALRDLRAALPPAEPSAESWTDSLREMQDHIKGVHIAEPDGETRLRRSTCRLCGKAIERAIGSMKRPIWRHIK
jgi:hypothetical protein